jgi:predicted DNA-binding transcriptional regulator AlpA
MLLSIDIYVHAHGRKMKKSHNSPPKGGGLEKPPKQHNAEVKVPLTTLPPEFLELIRAARACKTLGFIKADRTAEKSAIGVSTLWRDVKRKTFVPPIRTSIRSVAWVESEVDALLAAKALMSRTGKSIDLAQFVAALIE